MNSTEAGLRTRHHGSIIVHDQSPVAELVLRNPPVNALTTVLLEAWHRALDGLDAATRVLIIRSGLKDSFMAGGDLKLLTNGDSRELSDYVLGVQAAFSRLPDLPYPVISLIDGHCLGGGLELALATDMIVATARSTFALPEVHLGILPAGGGVHRLMRRVGERGRSLLVTGRQIDGQRAFEIGIVDELVEPVDSRAHVRDLATNLARLPCGAVTAIKRLSNHALDRSVAEGLVHEFAEWQAIRQTSETQAALSAFFNHGKDSDDH